MDKTIEQVFRVFNHLAREIQIYLFSGLVVATNAIIIDYFYYQSSLLSFVQTHNLLIPAAIILYLIGHFCMAFYYLILELPKLDKKINSVLKLVYQIDSKALPKIYSKNPQLYFHFVERYVILTMMRWTISAACFINLILDIIVVFKKGTHWQFLLATIIFALGALVFYILAVKTEKDYSDRITSLKEE